MNQQSPLAQALAMLGKVPYTQPPGYIVPGAKPNPKALQPQADRQPFRKPTKRIAKSTYSSKKGLFGGPKV